MDGDTPTRYRNISIGQAPESGLWDQYMPLYDIYSEDIRCGRGAWVSGGTTKTATVMAGDEVGFVVGRSADEVLSLSYFQLCLPYLLYLGTYPTIYIHKTDKGKIHSAKLFHDVLGAPRVNTAARAICNLPQRPRPSLPLAIP